MIKIAEIEDVDTILRMGRDFVKASPYAGLENEDKMKELTLSFINSPATERIIFLYEDYGMIAATVMPFLFGHVKVASEVVWWVDPDRRNATVGGALLEAFEYWAKQIGCRFVSMSCLDDLVGKFYESKDYKLYERAYIKEL